LCREPFEACVDAIVELVDAYRNFGPRSKLDSTDLVCTDWLYQAKMAVRTFLARTKDAFEDTPKHDQLKELLDELKQA
jgi:hypothetical protein